MQERVKWRKKPKWLVLRIKNGSKICVKKVVDLKDPCLYQWDIIDFATTRKDADSKAKKARNKKER